MDTITAHFSKAQLAWKAAGALLQQGIQKHHFLLLPFQGPKTEEVILSVSLAASKSRVVERLLDQLGANDVTRHRPHPIPHPTGSF